MLNLVLLSIFIPIVVERDMHYFPALSVDSHKQLLFTELLHVKKPLLRQFSIPVQMKVSLFEPSPTNYSSSIMLGWSISLDLRDFP